MILVYAYVQGGSTEAGIAAFVQLLAVPTLVAVGGVKTALVGIGALLPVIVVIRLRALMAIDDAATVPIVEIALLRRMQMFALLPHPLSKSLARALVPVESSAGTNIVIEGVRGDRFYVIADGTVDVTASGQHVTSLGRGDGFGEIALLYGIPRTATVAARTDVRLYGLERDAFLVALTGHASAHVAGQELVDRRLQELREIERAARVVP